jgi:hypothetical protein
MNEETIEFEEKYLCYCSEENFGFSFKMERDMLSFYMNILILIAESKNAFVYWKIKFTWVLLTSPTNKLKDTFKEILKSV